MGCNKFFFFLPVLPGKKTKGSEVRLFYIVRAARVSAKYTRETTRPRYTYHITYIAIPMTQICFLAEFFVVSKRFFDPLVNDPSAGSPTETLLRLLLPLSAPVRTSFSRVRLLP